MDYMNVVTVIAWYMWVGPDTHIRCTSLYHSHSHIFTPSYFLHDPHTHILISHTLTPSHFPLPLSCSYLTLTMHLTLSNSCSHVMPYTLTCYILTTSTPHSGTYSELGDGQVMEILQKHLTQWKSQEEREGGGKAAASLVLFRGAIEHATRLSRVMVRIWS